MVTTIVLGLVRAEIHRLFDTHRHLHLHLRVLPFHVHIHIRALPPVFFSCWRRGIICRRQICAVSRWRRDGAGTGARRVWWAALALLESVQNLLDVIPRKLFDLCLLFVRERLEFVVFVTRRLFLLLRNDVRELQGKKEEKKAKV